jgi:Tat protein translocase TatB subunit
MRIGLVEFVIVLLVAFIIVGPEDLPKVARTLARWVKAARKTMKDISGSFEEDLEQEDFIQAKKSFETDFKQANSELARIQQQVLDIARREDAAMNVKN